MDKNPTIKIKDEITSQLYERILSGEFVGVTKGTVTVIDENGAFLKVSVDDDNYKNGTLLPYFRQRVVVKDKNGNKKVIDVADFNNNEYDFHNKGKVLVKDSNNNNFMIDVNDARLISGELKLFWVGRRKSEETKKRMSAAQKGKKSWLKGKHKVWDNKELNIFHWE